MGFAPPAADVAPEVSPALLAPPPQPAAAVKPRATTAAVPTRSQEREFTDPLHGARCRARKKSPERDYERIGGPAATGDQGELSGVKTRRASSATPTGPRATTPARRRAAPPRQR